MNLDIIQAAPLGGAYVTIGNDGTLTSERALTGTANQVVITDNGANSTVVLSTPQDIHSGASPTFAGLTLSGLTPGSVVFAGAGGLLSQDNSNLFWDNTNNFLGVGLDGGAPAATLDVSRGVTDTSGSFNASSFGLIVFPGSASSAITTGLNLIVVPIGAQNITGQISGAIFGFGNLNTGTISTALGLQLNFRNQAAGTITSAAGGIFNLENLSTGTITTGSAGRFNIANANAGGLISTVQGVFISFTNSGTITDTFGVRVGNITGGIQTNTPFAFYADDAGAHNYFAGDLAIGTLAFPSTGDSFLIFGDGTAPATMGTNTAGLFANDDGGTVKMYAIDEAGSVALLNYRNIALGGGAAPTLGTIGGSGPTVSAQNSWVEFNTGGTAFWVPAWI